MLIRLLLLLLGVQDTGVESRETSQLEGILLLLPLLLLTSHNKSGSSSTVARADDQRVVLVSTRTALRIAKILDGIKPQRGTTTKRRSSELQLILLTSATRGAQQQQ
jgi:hypothetical protein